MVGKADDAKDALKTVGKVADTAGEFIEEKKQAAQGSYERADNINYDKRSFHNLY